MSAPTNIPAPGGEAPYLVHERPLAVQIRKYLVHLAGQVKSPIELSIRARPQGIATDIAAALLAHEQQFMPRKEELAAHEFADPHNALSIDMGRKELASYIAGIVVPLADNTWAQDVFVDIKIGHDLPGPLATHGMAMCILFDCKRGIVRQRFAPFEETELPSSEATTVTLGMTLVCRPGHLGMHQIHEDIGRGTSMGLLQSDAALFRWTIHTLRLMAGMRVAGDLRFTEDQHKVISAAGDALRADRIILGIRRAAEADALAVAAATAALSDSTRFAAQLQGKLDAVKNIDPALNEAITQLQKARAAPQAAAHTAVGAQEHTAAHSMLSEPPPRMPQSPHAMHHAAAEPQLVPEES